MGQMLKEDCGYSKCSCDSCNNSVDETAYIECNTTGRKFKIRRGTSCNLTKRYIYVACCIKMYESRCWFNYIEKPRLSNYKNHVHLRFTIADC